MGMTYVDVTVRNPAQRLRAWTGVATATVATVTAWTLIEHFSVTRVNTTATQ